MKKLLKDPEVYFYLGFLGLLCTTFSENKFVNIILVPIFFLLLFLGTFLVVKNYLKEKKNNKIERKK